MNQPFASLPIVRGMPEIKSRPPWPIRDVALIDLARHVAMQTPFDLEYIQDDTADLHVALKAKADEIGALPDNFPSDAAFEALTPFAFEWARNRAAEHANENRS